MYENEKKELIHTLENLYSGTANVLVFTAYRNGKKEDAFCIAHNTATSAPTFYFSDVYRDLENGGSIKEIVRKILQVNKSKNLGNEFSVELLKNFEIQKEKIAYKVVNTKTYEDQLPDIPSIPFHDLSIVFYGILEMTDEGCASYMITNSILEIWGITKEELYEIATRNTPKLLPLQAMGITQAMFGYEIVALNLENIIAGLPEDEPMYVITNIYKQNGFGSILYPHLLGKFAERFGDFYILPSSTHEALFIPKRTGMGISDLKIMVENVNETEVGPEIRLSNSVYLYDTKAETVHAF